MSKSMTMLAGALALASEGRMNDSISLFKRACQQSDMHESISSIDEMIQQQKVQQEQPQKIDYVDTVADPVQTAATQRLDGNAALTGTTHGFRSVQDTPVSQSSADFDDDDWSFESNSAAKAKPDPTADSVIGKAADGELELTVVTDVGNMENKSIRLSASGATDRDWYISEADGTTEPVDYFDDEEDDGADVDPDDEGADPEDDDGADTDDETQAEEDADFEGSDSAGSFDDDGADADADDLEEEVVESRLDALQAKLNALKK